MYPLFCPHPIRNASETGYTPCTKLLAKVFFTPKHQRGAASSDRSSKWFARNSPVDACALEELVERSTREKIECLRLFTITLPDGAHRNVHPGRRRKEITGFRSPEGLAERAQCKTCQTSCDMEGAPMAIYWPDTSYPRSDLSPCYELTRRGHDPRCSFQAFLSPRQ